ncbi:MAG: iron transporter [Syntrophomonadaceae bacterium]|nr:iron transporter [Syntrophomonadaceae bacterium]
MKARKSHVLILMLVFALSIFALGACSSNSQSSNNTPPSTSTGSGNTSSVAPGEAAGFEEFPLGDDIVLGPLNVAGVYFQPVDMEPVGNSLPASEADMHLEADISAAPNDLGYGVGDFVPNLTVKYELVAENNSVTEGNFMPMNASDGPHYGANVKFPGAGTYKVRFIITNPEAQGYLLHVDKETGVEGRFWKEPLVAEWDFDFVPRTW